MKKKIYRMLMFLIAVFSVFVCIVVAVAAKRAHLVSPKPSRLILDRHGQFLAEIGEGEFGYWPLESPPPRVVAATIALEDHRFWNHSGVDPVAIGRAIWQNTRSGKRISGASTLAMQIARMQSPGSRSYSRKFVEALTAIFLTERYGRDAILTHYLQIVPYGNRIHGIAYAARRYFDKPVEDLSWAEIAFLASLPQAPGRMNPFDPAGMADAIERGKRILNILQEDGVLNQTEFSLAMHDIVRLKMPERQKRSDEAMHAVIHLQNILPSDPYQNLIVQTTLDLDLQREISWKTFYAMRSWEKMGAGNAAVIVLDRNTNEVLAWIGSTDYFDKTHAGAIDFTQIPRSSGSTLKPFLYAFALEHGVITGGTILDDLHRASGGITNADEAYLGPLLPRVALANSRNVPAVDLLEKSGMDAVYAMFGDVGLHDYSAPAKKYGVGLAVGNLPVTLEQLVRAYTTLASDGHYGELIWLKNDKSKYRHILSEDTARQITLFLSDPMARLPGFPRMGATEYAFPVAVKTGTSYAHRDAWAVAYSARYLIGVWVGRPDYLPMNRLSGYRSAATLAQDVMLYLHRDYHDADISFPPPRGFHAVRLCALTGKIANPHCDRVFLEWFRPGQEPVETCDAHKSETIDTRTGAAATIDTPVQFQQVRTFVELPARYAAWAVSQNEERRGKREERRGTNEDATIRITLPENGLKLQRDPETPPDMATVSLQAVVDPPATQIVWYVDGAPFQVADYPYTARWPMQPGEHKIQAQVPYTNMISSPVYVHVR